MNDIIKSNMDALEKNEENYQPEFIESREETSVKAQVAIAKRFPRDEHAALLKILKACERPKLANEALYAYPRGGQLITGPSIRLAELIAKSWGNLDFGVREVDQQNGYSIVESFCWDLETNTRQVKIFKVPHERHTKRGKTKLTDPRDIYEHIANYAARRLRACILGIIPQDIIEDAVEKCEEAQKKGDGIPFQDRVKKMLQAFDALGVKKEMIEQRIGNNIDAIIPTQLVDLQKIYKSIKDGMADRKQFFDFGKTESRSTEELNEKFSKQ